ncbi:hypothetical protein SO802_023437 [Lithocarpus litseifolius]|uniref:Glutaredoxin domain-containing protein n=1 Tax=Lithocarpus litseifolius TaxID=425828 RepID=A0AAW2C9E4_9ROSI
MGSVFSSKISKEELEMALNKAKEIVSSNPVVVFSKTYCGYCKRVKQLLTQLGASYKIIELDEERKCFILLSTVCLLNRHSHTSPRPLDLQEHAASRPHGMVAHAIELLIAESDQAETLLREEHDK